MLTKLVAAADVPPAWSKTMHWVPLIGTYLKIILAQMQNCFTPLEDVAVESIEKAESVQMLGVVSLLRSYSAYSRA